ncbi:MAG: hypothetical protein KIH01_03985 [Candidatus Freyarchaeota archaeon]|nr:hypothetical protein [Candidatus Jordarchaeia archaeon]
MSTSQHAPSQNGEVDSRAQKIMELLAPVKEQVVRGILARFPMRGLEQILRETFDSAIVENLEVFSSLLNSTLQGCGGEVSEPKPQAKQEGDRLKAAMLEAKDFLKAPTQESEEISESLKENISRLKGEVDRLILELKIRDRKIREQERLLKKMRSLVENGLIPIFEGASSTADPELLSFWRRVGGFLEKDPKFKILRLLVNMKELTFERICQSVGMQKQLVARCLEEMKDADLIKVTGNNVTLKI